MTPGEWENELEALDVDELATLYDQADTAKTRSAAAELPLEVATRLEARAGRRRYLEATRIGNAARALEALPDAGVSLHCVMRGNFNAWDLVPAVLELAGVELEALHVATLSFNRDNVESLAELLDAGAIRRVYFLASTYMRTMDTDVYEHLAAVLDARGQHDYAAARNHAKVQLFGLADGRRLALESSANLRSCRNVEQFSLHHSADLYEFHAGWIEAMLREARQ